jgi:5-methylcytosine-specific restriction endonuclease McrA
MKRVKVCSTPGCPNLAPCPRHSRPTNAPWSKGRDRQAQHAFRQAVLQRDGHRCTRCGTTLDLVAHHVKPGYHPSAGITLCRACHQAIDTHAR